MNSVNSAHFHMSAGRNIIKDFFQIQEDSVSEEDQPIKVSQIWANTVQSK